MTRTEREAFLADLHVGVLAVEAPDGAPLAVPVWYGYEPGGVVEVITGRESRKGRLLADAGRFTLCVQTEAPPYRYVTVSGPVVASGPTDREAHLRPMARRYLGERMGDRYVADGPEVDEASVRILMRPERWYTVDYGKA
jgi:PPOX class probable F420-dependent enzyme